MWKDGASLGPTPHSVLRGPTKAHWYTDKHGTFSTPTQTKALLCSSAFIFSWQSVFNSEGKISNYLLVHCYLVTLITQQPPWNTKQHPFNATAENLKPSLLSTLLIRWACPRDNSLLTPWYQMASVIPTDKSLSENDCITRTSEKDFKAFSWSWQLKMFEKHCLRNHSLGNSESVKVFNVFTQTI